MKKLRAYIPVFVWCFAIFFFSSFQTTPSPQDTLLNFILKKIAHVLEYAILYVLTFRAMNESSLRRQYLKPLLFLVLYAIGDEIHQSFVPNRHARAYDVGFDTLGGLLMIVRIRSRDQRDARKKI
jgi:VanZ family protein